MQTNSDPLFSKINSLVVRLLEDTLSPAEQKELESLLISNPVARRLYIERIQEDACLRWLCAEDFADAALPVLELRAAPEQSRSRRAMAIVAGVLASVIVFVVCAQFFSSRKEGAKSDVASAAVASRRAH